jgi:hypothetical protein
MTPLFMLVMFASVTGDGALVSQEKELISGLRTRALAIESQGASVDDAGK